MPPSRVETWRRPLRWLATATLAALVPKCLACLAAYVGIGAALGGLTLASPELCGAPVEGMPHFEAWIATVGMIAGGLILWSRTRLRIPRPPDHCG